VLPNPDPIHLRTRPEQSSKVPVMHALDPEEFAED